jgi:16S rRNA (uracil1498-N3)-methyltransferase
MLWLAEKCAELEVTVWQPVVFRRSLSVSPRGEGPAFARKVRSRMRSALEQSGGAWLPELRPPQPLASVLADAEISGSCRFLLDRDGAPLVGQRAHGEASVLLGPEGGLDSAELRLARGEHGWMLASLGARTLRFETAGVIAAGILRSQLASSRTH